MQNPNNPQQPPPPQGGYGAPPPQPPAKKKMSTGVKVLIGVLVVALLGGVLVVALGAGALYYFSRGTTRGVAVGSSGGLPGSSSSDTDGAEPPAPTADQLAAVAGGQSAEWAQQEISWTVPQRWKKDSADSNSFNWSSPGTSDKAFLLVNVSPMGADFPVEFSNKAMYDQTVQRKQRGEVGEVRWLLLDGQKGVMFREAAPEGGSGSQRLQWIGYRKYKGQTQYVNIMLATDGKYFTQHEDAMYGILYSTKLSE